MSKKKRKRAIERWKRFHRFINHIPRGYMKSWSKAKLARHGFRRIDWHIPTAKEIVAKVRAMRHEELLDLESNFWNPYPDLPISNGR